MPVINWYIQNAAATGSNFGQMTESAPTAANLTTGWTVGKLAATRYAEMDYGTKLATGSFSTTSALASSTGPDNTTGTAWRSENTYSGAFPSGNWTFNFDFRPTTASTHTGRVRLRVWKSSSQTGSSPTELTTAILSPAATSAVFNSTATTVTSSVTWSAPAISLLNEYLFVEVEWQIDTAGGSNAADLVFRTGAATVATTNFTPNITASLATTEADDTAAVDTSVYWAATLAATEPQDTAAFDILGVNSASLAATEADDVAAVSATAVPFSPASLAATEPQDRARIFASNEYAIDGFEPSAFEATAFLMPASARRVNLVATENIDTASIAVSNGTVSTLTLAATEAQDTASLSASLYLPVTLAATEAKDTASIALSAFHTATLAATEASDTAALSSSVYWPATLAATEAKDTAALSSSVYWGATLAATEAQDTASISLSAWHNASLAYTEAPDTISISAANFHTATLAATEAKDTAAISAANFHTVVLAATEAKDTAAVSLSAWHNASLAATEAKDAASVSSAVYWPATLAATEAKDTASFDAGVFNNVIVNLNSSEAPDTVAIAAQRFIDMPADYGVFTYQGNDADMVAVRGMVLDPGTYVYTGFPATMGRIWPDLNAGTGTYTYSGYAARLYESSFFYTDSEVIYVPQEINTVLIDPAVVDADVNIVAAAEIQHILLDFEDRLIQVPASDDEIEELIEYRQADAEARMRTT